MSVHVNAEYAHEMTARERLRSILVRVRFDGGLGGLNPLAHNANPPSLLEMSTPGGRIIQAFNPPVQYFQHILTSTLGLL